MPIPESARSQDPLCSGCGQSPLRYVLTLTGTKPSLSRDTQPRIAFAIHTSQPSPCYP